MDMKKTYFILDEPKKKQDNCRYMAICYLYANNSFTCTHTGGNYCGKYRKLGSKPNLDGNIQPNGQLIELPQ